MHDPAGAGIGGRVSRRTALLFACLALPGASAALASCSGDDPGTSAPAADAATEQQRPRPREELPPEDAGPDARRPPPTIPACVGSSRPLEASGEQAFVRVQVGGDAGAEGAFLLDFGANGSTIDFGGFDGGAPSPTSCLGDAGAPGALCTFADLDFFGSWGPVSLVTADYSFLFHAIRQAGILGTDFLSVHPFTLDYLGQRVWRADPGSFCTDAQLLAAGYAPIPAGGFYTNDFGKLRPLSDVITDPDASTANFTVPNVPTIPVAIAGVTALAQIDTGYDDRIYRHSININPPLLEKLLEKDPDLLTRRPSMDLYLTTCVPGLSQAGRAYLLPAGASVDFLAEGGTVGRHDTGKVLFVKERLPAAERCGGIETWTVPAAQLGASFMVDAAAVVFDPITTRVWLPRD